MGIIQTDQWLDAEFDRPLRICDKLLPAFKGENATGIYHQLAKFGMYKPTKATRNIFDSLRKNNVWEKVDQHFQNYKNKWSGPEIPIYLFPINQQRGFFSRNEEDKIKGGVSYPDKMFLFLSDKITAKELEALFIHEYHHVCRLTEQNKKFEDYTLLDSIIIEGLAEYAVLKNCGKKYLANWCNQYTNSEIIDLWNKYVKDELDIKKNERGHDELLFGSSRVPSLLGYAIGYRIVDNYYQKHNYSTKLSFKLSAKKYLEHYKQ